MKQLEKDELLRQLNEKQLQLASVMSQSDAHAAKCVKLGLSFAETYPDEYKEYTAAREQYNENELAISELEATPVEEPAHNPDKQ